MMAFGEYAKYYDLLYADKDYAAETAFVREIIRRLAPGARTLLELGCGSARHALELVRNRFTVTGADLSAQMIARADAQVTQLPLELRSRIKLMQGMQHGSCRPRRSMRSLRCFTLSTTRLRTMR